MTVIDYIPVAVAAVAMIARIAMFLPRPGRSARKQAA